MIGRLAAGLCVAGLALAAPAAAQQETIAAALAALQHKDARLQTIGWRLVTGNARFCADARPAAGLLLQDMMNYTAPDPARAAAGIRGDIAVQAVAEGSPAAQAGLLPNDELLAIDGQDVAAIPAPKRRVHRRLSALQDRIDAALAASGTVGFGVRRADGTPRELLLTGVRACPGRFVLRTGSSQVEAADGTVFIGERFGDQRHPDDAPGDDEYAAMVAHELAHVLLRHGAWLDQAGRSWGKVRRTEREADRLAIWLLVNAGFDPEAGPRLMANWGRRTDPGILGVPDHDGWQERVELMRREVTRVRAVLKQRGEADWARDFIRGL